MRETETLKNLILILILNSNRKFVICLYVRTPFSLLYVCDCVCFSKKKKKKKKNKEAKKNKKFKKIKLGNFLL